MNFDSESAKVFRKELLSREEKIENCIDDLIDTNPLLSDVEMAKMIWKEIFDLEPFEPIDKNEAFQCQIGLVKLMRKNRG